MSAIIQEKFVTATFLGLNKDLHGEIRSWITYDEFHAFQSL